jgi:hypothetical protein
MKGHLRERSPGHWAIVIDVRDPATGKRKWHGFAARSAMLKTRTPIESPALSHGRHNQL